MRAKSHDQRKGQWLINKIRHGDEYKNDMDRYFKKYGFGGYIYFEKSWIECTIWNMENDEFDRLMEDYDK